MNGNYKPGTRGFQAGTLSNAKDAQLQTTRFIVPTRSGRYLVMRRDW